MGKQWSRTSLSWLLLTLSTLNFSAFSLSMTARRTRGATVIAGATGYIGKSAVRESVRQGFKTYALVRDRKKLDSTEGKRLYGDFFNGAAVVEVDVSDPAKLAKVSFTCAIILIEFPFMIMPHSLSSKGHESDPRTVWMH